jgi:magnesium-transporting ATPase (P-type)
MDNISQDTVVFNNQTWWLTSIEMTFKALSSSASGLDDQEANRRLKQCGRNVFHDTPRKHFLIEFERRHQSVGIRAAVLRRGTERNIQVELLVPADIVHLSAGNLMPADGLVIQAKDFFVKQAALTGEPFRVFYARIAPAQGFFA